MSLVPYFAQLSPPSDSVWGFEQQQDFSPGARTAKRGALLRGDDGNEYIKLGWVNDGWEIQPWQPPHPTPEKKSAAIARGDDGIEYIRLGWLNAGWEVAPPITRYKRPMPVGWSNWNEDGNELPLVAATPPFGYDPLPFIYRKRFIPSGWSDWNDDGNEYILLRWQNTGWEVQPPQPPARPTVRQRYQATKGGTVFGVFTPFVPVGWEVAPPITRYKRPLPIGWPAWNDDGNYGTQQNYVSFYDTTSALTHYKQPHPVGWPNWNDDGNQATQITFRPYGWDVQPPQPPHPRPEKSGVQFGAINIDGTLTVTLVALDPGFEVQPWQPPHFRPEQRSAGLVGGDTGTQAVFVYVPPPPPTPTSPPGGGDYPIRPGQRKPIQPIWQRRQEAERKAAEAAATAPTTAATTPPIVAKEAKAPAGTVQPWDFLNRSGTPVAPPPAPPPLPRRGAKLRIAEDDDVSTTVVLSRALLAAQSTEGNETVKATANARVAILFSGNEADTSHGDSVSLHPFSFASREEPDRVRATAKMADGVDEDSLLGLLDEPRITSEIAEMLLQEIDDLRPKPDPKVIDRLDSLEEALHELAKARAAQDRPVKLRRNEHGHIVGIKR